MGTPGVRVGTGIAGHFRPCTEMQRQEIPPWSERIQVTVGHTRVVKSAREVEAKIVGGCQDIALIVTGLNREDTLDKLCLGCCRNHVIKYREDIGLLAESRLLRRVG